jgi:Chitobiase/beta-hexosaminidase C-terminal domain/Bacterial Ig-like domain (group 3)/Beta-propeller repeat
MRPSQFANSQESFMFVMPKSSLFRVMILLGILAAAEVVAPAQASPAVRPSAKTPAARKAEMVKSYGKLPLRFEANRGQTDKRARFLARGGGYGIFLTQQEAVLSLHRHAATDVVTMQLAGSSTNAEPAGENPLPGKSNYLLGSDPAQWHTNVPAFAKVRYSGVYPGVDLIYYGNQQQLEYDFVVAPGADPAPIRIHFAGATGLKLDSGGDLVVLARNGSIAFQHPVVYQVVSGRRQLVRGSFALAANQSASFVLGNYDHSKPLVIDPSLIYATYLGGSNLDTIASIAVDATGAAYLAGTTSSTDFPVTPGVIETTDKDPHGTSFITKLNASGTALIYSTFLGGSGSNYGGDTAKQIAVDGSGEAYAVGSTCSTDFPVTQVAFQTTNKAAANSQCTAFVSELNASGTALVYSTFLGGTGTDSATALVLDSAKNIYVAGSAASSNFPTTAGVVQTTNKSAAIFGWNEFVAKINPAASGAASLVYSTYLGGSDEYSGPDNMQVAVDKSGDAYVSGIAISTDFPVTTGAYQTTKKAPSGHSDMTMSKLNPTATKLLYSTYLGGTGSPYGDDEANALAVDSSGNVYLSGNTWEADYPVTKGAFQTTSNSVANSLASGFITKMNPEGSALVYSTYLSGSGGDRAFGLGVDNSGNAYITGSAHSTDFPVTKNAFQTSNPAAFNNGAVVFLTELNPVGAALVYSTYLGGQSSFDDTGYGVALGSGGAVYLAGFTNAPDFPVTKSAYQTNFNSQQSTTGFVAEFNLGSGPAGIATATSLATTANPAVVGTNLTFTADVIPATGTAIPTGNVVFSINEKAVATVPLNAKGWASYSTTTPLAIGQYAILASYAGSATYVASGGDITQTIAPARPVITPPGGTYQSAQLVAIHEPTAGNAIYYTTDGSVPALTSTKYTGPILVSSQQTIRAIAGTAGLPASSVATESYTLLNAPTVLAVQASAISTPKATLNALVDTYGMAGTYYFRYGTSSAALTSTTPSAALQGSVFGGRVGFIPVPVSNQLTTLAAKTTYYYQVVVTTGAGISSGQVLSFKTN